MKMRLGSSGAALPCLFLLLYGSVRGDAQAAPPAPNFLEQMESAVTTIVKSAQKSVVSIEVRVAIPNFPPRPPVPPVKEKQEQEKQHEAEQDNEKEEKNAQGAIRGQINEMAQAFGMTRTGSGFLLQGGFVVTTYEVVAQSKEPPVVIMDDGKRVRVEKVSPFKKANVAVLKVDVPKERGLAWGDSDKVAAGNFAITIGNQAGFMNSASLGLIAGINRAGFSGGKRYDNLLQFQGAVGVGGSGSPVLNSRGEVIGMVIAAPAGAMIQQAQRADNARPVQVAGFNGAAQPANAVLPQGQAVAQDEKARAGVFFFGGLANTGFALPSNMLSPVVEIIMKGGQPAEPGWMGVYLGETKANLRGAPLSRVFFGTPADNAGLRPGDLIATINGRRIRSKEDAQAALQKVLAGQAIRLEVKRGTMTLSRTLITEPKPDQEEINNLPYQQELP